MSTVRTRFAPSPTGYLHIGGLRTALYAYLYAKQKGGKFILRIEDTDTARKVEGAEEVIYSTLKAAGLVYDEGPDVGGKKGPYIQSQRTDTYQKYADKLVKNGGAYVCFCGRERLDSLSQGGIAKYDKHCLKLDDKEIKMRKKAGEPFVIRQNIPQEGSTTYTDLVFGDIVVDNKELEDGVLIKSDGTPTYNFANVIDDHLMDINVVMRGTEYLSSTPKYNYIYKGLGWDLPTYIHMQPIMRDATHKLSKRDGDASYNDFIASGYIGEAIVNYIALLGWSPKENKEKMSLKEMIEMFSVDGLSRSSSIFDIEKLKWLNAQYVRELEVGEFIALAKPFLDKLYYIKDYDLEYLASLVQPRCTLLADVADVTKFLNEFDNYDLNLLCNEKNKTDLTIAKAMLPDLIDAVDKGFDDLTATFTHFATTHNHKKGQVMWIFRIAITGALVTCGGASEMAKLLGRDTVVARLQETLKRLNRL